MSYVILGKTVSEFKVDDGTVSGTNVFLGYPISKAKGDGVEPIAKIELSKKGTQYVAKSKFVSSNVSLYKDIRLNTECEVYFDESGKIKRIDYIS